METNGRDDDCLIWFALFCQYYCNRKAWAARRDAEPGGASWINRAEAQRRGEEAPSLPLSAYFLELSKLPTEHPEDTGFLDRAINRRHSTLNSWIETSASPQAGVLS